jgi:hypothetical protein
MMWSAIVIPPASKFAVICFLRANNMCPAESHRELCAAVCGQNVMSEGTVRQWCIVFKDGRTDVRDEKQSVRPAIYSE